MKQLLLLFILIPFLSFCQIQIGQDIDGEAANDRSGLSLSLSSDGSIVAIGAGFNDGINGVDSGHVRVYKNINGLWTQIGQDIDGEASEDKSGSVSISLSSDGSIIAISALSNSGMFLNSGHVRVYKNISGVWTQIGQDIDGEVVNENFGRSISLSSDGSILVVGSNAAGGGINNNAAGHVHIYENIGGVWTQIGDYIDGEANADNSGISVSSSSDGSFIAVGAPGNDGNGNESGHVRVYENIGGIWTQVGQDIDGEESFDESGTSVSLSSDGSVVAIGAPRNTRVVTQAVGHVRVYKNINNVWIQVGQDIDGELLGDFSGSYTSLSSDGTIIVISATGNDGNGNNSGHVRIYKNMNNNWIQVGQDINGEAANDGFGKRADISSDGLIVAVSANNNDGNGNNSGHVRVFSIASELATLEVVEDIAGNNNGINVTAAQLNSIDGVSGAVNGVNYTTALDNGTFVDENNPTAAEIQAIIDQVNATLGVRDDSIFNFKLHPNPTKNQFTIQLNNTTELKNVNIYNNQGQLILTSKETTIKTSKLSTGLYVVEIETNKGKGSKKLIIE